MRYVRLDRLEELERQVRNAVRCAREAAIDVPAELIETHDGGPNLRPHTIPGHWQVWSGGICIALLTPKDVEPLRASLSNTIPTDTKTKEK